MGSLCRITAIVFVLLAQLLAPGCSREAFRRRADFDAYHLIDEKGVDTRWQSSDFSIDADPLSRFYDPFCPNHPPMPADDPGAEYVAPTPQRPDCIEGPLEGVEYLHLLPTIEVSEQDPQYDPLLHSSESLRLLTPDSAYQVGLVNSRDYQDRKENLYLASLNVSVERFAFGPQWFATQQLAFEKIGSALPGGDRPTHITTAPGPLAGTVVTPGTTVTAAAADGQTVSRFTGPGHLAGTGFGAGQLFATGGALLLRFANKTVVELSGPFRGDSSQSEISLDLVQPLLQGGGRAVTLEPLAQSERILLYRLRSYARFQREFLVSVLTGSSLNQQSRLDNSQDADNSGNRRRIGLLPLLEQLQVLLNESRNLERLQSHRKRFEAFEKAGEVSRLQVDQVRQDVAQARSRVLQARRRFFANLDRFKIQLGLPTDLPLVVDEKLLASFELDDQLCEFPNLPPELPPMAYKPDEALKLAIENRLDLMNARANLVDHWRKIAVAANGLTGVLNVEYRSSWLTPDPATANHPLDFFNGGTSRHRMALNAELPLVRIRERNIYRATLIEYQRARRSLMAAEDTVRLEIRTGFRTLEQSRQEFQIQREAVVLACRRVDQARRILDLPPKPGEPRELGTNSARNLLEAQEDLVKAQNDLVAAWVDYQTARLELLRDMELLDTGEPNPLAIQSQPEPEELPDAPSIDLD